MTANTSAYGKGAAAYQQTSDDNLGPMEIALELFKGIITFLKQAKSAYEADDLEQMTYFLDRVFKIIEALHAHLDMDAGGKDAEFLQGYYATMIGRMGKLFDRPDIPAEFDQLIAYTTPIYESWYQLTHGALPTAPSDDDDQNPDAS